MILSCVIVDDEPMARKLLQEYIEETDFLKLVGVAENPLKAIELLSNTEVDLIFLDINMPKMNGMAFLRSSVTLPMVIMTTAYGQYALEGFEMAVIDYLVKPFSIERFIKAAQKALELKALKQKNAIPEKARPDYFYVKCDGKFERVVYNELLYIEGMTNYVTLYTTDKKLIVYLTIKGVLEKLPADIFMQVHKSYIVNTRCITTIEGHTLHLGNKKITMGANYADELMKQVLNGRFIKR